jgi:hypothetical protein
MERVLYVVAREQPFLVGYLMTTVGARPFDGPPVEIKLDERRAERRLSRDAWEPERRRGERRRQPTMARDFRSRGYAVVQSGGGSSRTVEPTPPAMVWRPRSSWWQRAARAERRSRVWWGLILALLAGVGVVIVVAGSIDWTPAPPLLAPRITPPRVPPRITPGLETAPPPPASRGETIAPTVPPAAPATPAPGRIVSTRFSGVVLSVDRAASVLVLEDRGAAGAAARLRVELAPDARVVLSERDGQAEDPSRAFKDTPISLSDIGRGDYVVVERRGPEGKQLAHSIVVTFRNIK